MFLEGPGSFVNCIMLGSPFFSRLIPVLRDLGCKIPKIIRAEAAQSRDCL